MKRYIMIAVIAALIGKVYVVAVSKIAQKALKSNHIGSSLFDDKQNENQFRLNAPHDTRVSIKSFHDHTEIYHPRMMAPIITPPAKVAALPKQSKKDQERRKKRQKALEDKVAKDAKSATSAAKPTQIATQTPSGSANSSAPAYYGIGSTEAAEALANNSAPVDTTPANTTTGVASSKKSTMSALAVALLKTPNEANMNAFVSAYNKHEVVDRVFYGTLEELLKNPNTTIQQLALYGANLVHGSGSFDLLADTSQNTSSNNSVSSEAQADLNAYANVDSLGILEEALNKGDQAQKLVAATLLNTIVGQSLSSGITSSQMQSYFGGFIPVLNHLTQSNSNSALGGLAAGLLHEISKSS